MSLLKQLHKRLLRDTLGRTQRVNLIKYIISILPDTNATVLDIGCGNGLFSSDLMKAMPRLDVVGIETRPHADCLIRQHAYDGAILPFADKSFDYVLLINMLHHTDDPEHMLAEASRVTRNLILVKDHYANSRLDFYNLVLMEWIGNAFTGIPQPYKFLSETQWNELFKKLDLHAQSLLTRFVSYNALVDLLCGRNMHFIATLKPSG